MTFCDLGVPKQDRVHFCVSCVSGHFVGPKYFQTSKFSGIGASSKVVRKLRDAQLFWGSQNMRKPLWRRSVRKLSTLLKGLSERIHCIQLDRQAALNQREASLAVRNNGSCQTAPWSDATVHSPWL